MSSLHWGVNFGTVTNMLGGSFFFPFHSNWIIICAICPSINSFRHFGCCTKTMIYLNLVKQWLARHSAGALVAVNSYFEAPERVAALILIAPAILAPRLIQKVDEANPLGRNEQTERDTSNLVNLLKPFLKVYTILSMFLKYITQAMMQVAKGMADMLHSLYKKVLSATLRSAVGVTLVHNFFLDDFHGTLGLSFSQTLLYTYQ